MKRLKYTKSQAKKLLNRPLLAKKLEGKKVPSASRKFKPAVILVDRIPIISWKNLCLSLIPLWAFYLLAHLLWEKTASTKHWHELLLRLSRTAPAYTLPFLLAALTDVGLRLLIDKGQTAIRADLWNTRYKAIWGGTLLVCMLVLPGGIWSLQFMPYGFFSGIIGVVVFLVLLTGAMNASWRHASLLEAEDAPTNPVEGSKNGAQHGLSQ